MYWILVVLIFYNQTPEVKKVTYATHEECVKAQTVINHQTEMLGICIQGV